MASVETPLNEFFTLTRADIPGLAEVSPEKAADLDALMVRNLRAVEQNLLNEAEGTDFYHNL